MAKIAFIGRPSHLRKEPQICDFPWWPESGRQAPTVRVPEFKRGRTMSTSYVTIVDYEYWKTTSAGVLLYKRPGYRVGSL